MSSSERSTVPRQTRSASQDDSGPTRDGHGVSDDVRLEPVPDLEWSLALEEHPPVYEATGPAALRCSWIHQAPEAHVLALFRKLDGSARRLPAPWWLRPLDRGELPSRTAGFEIEDDIHALLASRPGWVFVPWGDAGEVGYWEYSPSDREPMKMPTTVVLTDEHPGWIHVVAAHAHTAGLPLPVQGASGLLWALPRIESWYLGTTAGERSWYSPLR